MKIKTSLTLFPILIMLAEMAAYLSNDMYLPALTAVMKDLNLSAAELQTTLTAWFLGASSMQLIIGPLSDRFGRRPILIVGMLLFVISSLLCFLSQSLALLLLARFLQGSTVCCVIVAGYASIHELFDQREAIHLLARMNSIIVLAPAFGPFVGSVILMFSSWRGIFGFLMLFGLGVLVTLILFMPEPLAPEKRQAFRWQQLFKQYFAIISNLGFWLFLIPNLAIFGGFIAWLAAGPFYVVEAFHHEPLIFGLYQILICGFYILGNKWVRPLMEKIGVSSLIKLGLGVALVAGILTTSLALIYPQFLGGLILGTALFALGFGLSSASTQRLAIESSDQPMGLRMAVVSTLLGLSGLIATSLVGVFYHGHLMNLGLILLGAAFLANGSYYLAAPTESSRVKD